MCSSDLSGVLVVPRRIDTKTLRYPSPRGDGKRGPDCTTGQSLPVSGRRAGSRGDAVAFASLSSCGCALRRLRFSRSFAANLCCRDFASSDFVIELLRVWKDVAARARLDCIFHSISFAGASAGCLRERRRRRIAEKAPGGRPFLACVQQAPMASTAAAGLGDLPPASRSLP